MREIAPESLGPGGWKSQERIKLFWAESIYSSALKTLPLKVVD